MEKTLRVEHMGEVSHVRAADRAAQGAALAAWICETCGTQFARGAVAPDRCPICDDERQYVGWGGQRWTTMGDLARDRRVSFAVEDGVVTFDLSPGFAISQRAFLVPSGRKHVMWECLSLVTPEAIAEIESKGGVSCIAISHPHFYAAMVEWSEALGGVPIYLHEADRRWVQRTSPLIEFWKGERLALGDELELVRLAGHFPGSTGLWWKSGPRPGGSLFPGDALQVASDRRFVTFMYSYPNWIPLNPSVVRALRDAVAPLVFDDVFGYSRGRQIIGNARMAIDASFARYLAAIAEAA